MKRGSTLFLKFVIVLLALLVTTGLVAFPPSEGRSQGLNLMQIYMDPVILYMYVGALPFFFALFQAFKLLGFVDKNNIFSQAAIAAVRKIKYCALAIPVFIFCGLAFLVLNAQGDDFAGPVALGVYLSFASLVIATGSAVFEKLLQNATDMKSENDLTV